MRDFHCSARELRGLPEQGADPSGRDPVVGEWGRELGNMIRIGYVVIYIKLREYVADVERRKLLGIQAPMQGGIYGIAPIDFKS